MQRSLIAIMIKIDKFDNIIENINWYTIIVQNFQLYAC